MAYGKAAQAYRNAPGVLRAKYNLACSRVIRSAQYARAARNTRDGFNCFVRVSGVFLRTTADSKIESFYGICKPCL
jgi:hypothetical protein